MTRYEYQLADGVVKVTSSDLRLSDDETVELTEDEAERLNKRHSSPVLEKADSDGVGDDADEDDS